jgi:plastocyanin domain-containing protein
VVKAGEPDVPVSEVVAPVTGAIRVRVSSSGFEPARLEVLAGKPTRIAFTRADAQNCANEVVFPEPGRKRLPPGETTVVELPPHTTSEMRFACGMGMYHGAVVIRGVYCGGCKVRFNRKACSGHDRPAR